jgi:rSAM/selenodomain-associated transferase 2
VYELGDIERIVESLSVVIPILNDEIALARLLSLLGALLHESSVGEWEIVVVDGGSVDHGCAVALQQGCHVVHAPTGRGSQLRAGCVVAGGDWLWLLHADSVIDAAAVTYLAGQNTPCWGRFDVQFGGRQSGLRVVAAMMNLRSRLTGMCTGDQGVFVHRTLLESVGGVPSQPLMEDIELSKRLRRRLRPCCTRVTVTTSSRRWETRGIVRTMMSMWWFRVRYWCGADPERLATEYYSW